MKTSYHMKLIDGSPASKRRKYIYRGHVITQEYRPHDVRNKTHNGYFWHVAFAGTDASRHNLATRKEAKHTIDLWENARS